MGQKENSLEAALIEHQMDKLREQCTEYYAEMRHVDKLYKCYRAQVDKVLEEALEALAPTDLNVLYKKIHLLSQYEPDENDDLYL